MEELVGNHPAPERDKGLVQAGAASGRLVGQGIDALKKLLGSRDRIGAEHKLPGPVSGGQPHKHDFRAGHAPAGDVLLPNGVGIGDLSVGGYRHAIEHFLETDGGLAPLRDDQRRRHRREIEARQHLAAQMLHASPAGRVGVPLHRGSTDVVHRVDEATHGSARAGGIQRGQQFGGAHRRGGVSWPLCPAGGRSACCQGEEGHCQREAEQSGSGQKRRDGAGHGCISWGPRRLRPPDSGRNTALCFRTAMGLPEPFLRGFAR